MPDGTFPANGPVHDEVGNMYCKHVQYHSSHDLPVSSLYTHGSMNQRYFCERQVKGYEQWRVPSIFYPGRRSSSLFPRPNIPTRLKQFQRKGQRLKSWRVPSIICLDYIVVFVLPLSTPSSRLKSFHKKRSKDKDRGGCRWWSVLITSQYLVLSMSKLSSRLKLFHKKRSKVCNLPNIFPNILSSLHPDFEQDWSTFTTGQVPKIVKSAVDNLLSLLPLIQPQVFVGQTRSKAEKTWRVPKSLRKDLRYGKSDVMAHRHLLMHCRFRKASSGRWPGSFISSHSCYSYRINHPFLPLLYMQSYSSATLCPEPPPLSLPSSHHPV